MKEAFQPALVHGRGLNLGKAIALGLILGSAVGLSSVASAGPTYPTGNWTSDITVTSTTGAAVGVSADNNSTNTVSGYNNIMVTGDTAADGVKVTNGGTTTIVMNGDLKAVTGTNTKKDDVNSMTDGVSAKDGNVNITGVKSISGETAGAGDAYGINVDNSTIGHRLWQEPALQERQQFGCFCSGFPGP